MWPSRSVVGLLQANDLGRQFEVLYGESFEGPVFRQRIIAWFNALILRHFEATQDLVTEKLE